MYKHLSPLALAWCYQDDGHLRKKSNTPQKIILSTDSFMPYENKGLSHILWEKFSLDFAMDKQNRLILYDQFQIRYFLYLIQLYLHHSMRRKTISSMDLSSSQTSSKRSIYLPANINISSPTSEINDKLSTLSTVLQLLKIDSFYNKEIFDIYKSFHQY
ncbi:hypothetical protein [Bacillus sp. es.034]|uniref:hypothetical protein n=1 Tax=Bacillus sp. es.034 TaxID=1761763 RepID=UPI000BF57A55